MTIFSEVAEGLGLSLRQAAQLFPPSRRDRPVAMSSISRWVHEGVRGRDGQLVRLEAAKLSGRWITSQGAIERFLAAQTK